ncbi:RmlC-like cupin domain-containing protein [Hygrophoropsis aurantiaca]|uniref:RmlC-like cupin domain-containing protein n=1 Tax=Hygrophoropsis aurantiaca TaxID=72124 RepID=A0ACB8A6I9_9AGAM|nr:RmlC-like cupin domain-containing protein [Hygrophoropsis aurantiaca]
MPGVKIIPRRSEERGHADHGWLKTFHTFSFADYGDINHQNFGPLRVINEDRVRAHTGFGMHSHREFEIFSYIISGELEHADSMGNTEVLPRGAVQMTSTGTGISHSEKAHGNQEVHFCQIWAVPRPGEGKGKPAYFTRKFSDAQKLNQFALLVAPSTASEVSLNREDSGPAPIRSQLRMYAALIEPGATVAHTFKGNARKGYLHVIQKSGYNPKKAGGDGARVRVDGGDPAWAELGEGDGAYLVTKEDGGLVVRNEGDRVAEVLLFDLE